MRYLVKIFPVAAFVVAVGCATAPVQQSPVALFESLDGNGLRQLCADSPQTCQEYVMRSFKATLTKQGQPGVPQRLCPRGGLAPDHVVAVVKRYLKARPEVGQWTADKVIAYATVAAFPCYDMGTRY